MSTVTIDATDVADAADFLQQFLTDKITDGDFSKGTALRDLAVNAIAAVVAFLRADATQIRQMQSLVTVQAAVGTGDPDALRDAVSGILSNLFVQLKGGGNARGFAIGHATQQVDVFIATSARFTFTQGVVFVVDSTDTLFVAKEELVPIVDSDGTVLDYEFRIPLVAIATGEAYNVEPGLFTAFDRFNPYVTRVETTVQFSGGKGPETVDEVLARAPTAVSVRNLVNDRSIEDTLEDNFDGIQAILVIGMGDPEMQRDIVPTVAPNLRFHIGGCVDVYLRTGLVETSFIGSVGDLYMRPDGVAVVFRDPNVSFITAGVQAGDIVRVTGGLVQVPAEFLVEEVIDQNTLMISDRAPFPVATDEASPPSTVIYVIGRVSPSYSDVISSGGLPITSGITSRRSTTSGRVTLPGGPVMDILDVAIINPATGETAFKSTLDGLVHFPNQVNTTPSQAQTSDQGLQFQVVTHNPLFAQSALQWMEIVVGTDTQPTRFDGFNLRVRYRTLASFDVIDAFVRGARERISSAFQLPRGHSPVVVSMDLKYTVKATATALPDPAKIAQSIIDYVNAFDAGASSIDVSTIIQLVKNTYPDIGNILPPSVGAPILTIRYDLRAPTGDVLSYVTTDVVSVDPAKQAAGPALVLIDLGVSDRTLRYVANAATITAEQA
jgi:hypothetical protein